MFGDDIGGSHVTVATGCMIGNWKGNERTRPWSNLRHYRGISLDRFRKSTPASIVCFPAENRTEMRSLTGVGARSVHPDRDSPRQDHTRARNTKFRSVHPAPLSGFRASILYAYLVTLGTENQLRMFSFSTSPRLTN
jgi:hypothetical protein